MMIRSKIYFIWRSMDLSVEVEIQAGASQGTGVEIILV